MPFLQEYTMLNELGKGGFATVYKVRHNELGYIRAVRVLNETIVNDSSETYRKFLRECKMLLRLGNGNHSNIVHIYQPRLLENKALVEMDYVSGLDVFHYLKQNQNFVPVEEVVRMAEQISSALAYCHEDIYSFCMDRDFDHLQDDPNDGTKVLLDYQTRKRLIAKYKVIHNDIHSGNIMRRDDGNFVLLDFGLAINGNEVVRSSRHRNGAPEFKAPEKWDDDSILSEQSDIYSFGVVLYQYLAGRVPFPFNTSVGNHVAEFELGEAHQKLAPPPIAEIRKGFFEKNHDGQTYHQDYPAWLEELIMKCLQKNPTDRFKNGKELYDFILRHKKNDNFQCFSEQVESLSAANRKLISEMNNLSQANRDLEAQINDRQDIILKLQQKLFEIKEQLEQQTNTKKSDKYTKLLIVLLFLFLLVEGITIYLFIERANHTQQLVTELNDTIVLKNTELQSKDYELDKLRQEYNFFLDNVENPKQIKQLADSLAEKDAQMSELQAKLSQQEKVISNINKQLSETKKQLTEANKNLSETNRKLSESNKKHSETKTTIATESSKITELKQYIDNQNREMDKFKKEMNNKKDSLKDALNEIETLRKKMFR